MNEEDGAKKRFALRGGTLTWALGALGLVLCVALLGHLLHKSEPVPAPEVRMAAKAPGDGAPPQTSHRAQSGQTTDASPTSADGATDADVALGTAADSAAKGADAASGVAGEAPHDGGYQGFEETLGVPLERIVRQIDYALVETLLLTGYDPHAMAIAEVELKRYHDEQYHYQRLDITLDNKPSRFLASLRPALKKWAPETALDRAPDGGFAISVLGNITHSLSFATVPSQPSTQAVGLMSVVIDDLGRDMKFARELAALPFPVTFSILPFQPHTREVATLAAKAGREILLHLPMEPKAYPAVNPGKGALFTTMDSERMRSVLASDLQQLPGARGANNHMGSKFTQTAAAMAVVMEALSQRSMFFLDSLTAPRSTGVSEAKAAGLPVYRRSVFLDNIRDIKAIMRQLDKAERMAATRGQAVAIGHPYPETLEALKEWGQRQERAARVVPVRTLKPVKQ